MANISTLLLVAANNHAAFDPGTADAVVSIASMLWDRLEVEVQKSWIDTTDNRPVNINNVDRQPSRLPDKHTVMIAWQVFLARPEPLRPRGGAAVAPVLGEHDLVPWWELCLFGCALYIISQKYAVDGLPAFPLPALIRSLLGIRCEYEPAKGAIWHQHADFAGTVSELCHKFHTAKGDLLRATWALYVSLCDKTR